MAQNYKLVKKKNLGKDSETIPQKMFAIPSYNGFAPPLFRPSCAGRCRKTPALTHKSTLPIAS